jgi:hypothetical protein
MIDEAGIKAFMRKECTSPQNRVMASSKNAKNMAPEQKMKLLHQYADQFRSPAIRILGNVVRAIVLLVFKLIDIK